MIYQLKGIEIEVIQDKLIKKKERKRGYTGSTRISNQRETCKYIPGLKKTELDVKRFKIQS